MSKSGKLGSVIAFILCSVLAFGCGAMIARGNDNNDSKKENSSSVEDSLVDDGTTDEGSSDSGSSEDGTTDDDAIDDGTTDEGSSDSGSSDEGTADEGTPRDERTTLIANDITYYAIEVGDNLSGSAFLFSQSTYEAFNGSFKISFETVDIDGSTYDIYYSGHGGDMYLLDASGDSAYAILKDSYGFPASLANGTAAELPEFDLVVKSIEYPEDLTTCPFYVDNYAR